MDRIKLDNIETSRSEMNDCIRAPTIVLKPRGQRNRIRHCFKNIHNLPGTTATVFNALSTRNVRNTATLPKLMKNVIYLDDKRYLLFEIKYIYYLKQ